jgi:lipid II:glycine glycyltransferase (peptidoglycan interpeptide bridge formation enzyme)
MAQLRLARIPLQKAGVAYLISGPLWRPKGEPTSVKHLQNMIRALYNEYVARRRFLLLVLPRTIRESEADIRDIFREERFSWRPDPQQTVYVDLSPSLDEIRKNMRKQWRQTLQRAEKQKIEIAVGSREDVYAGAVKIIEEMKERKKYVEYGDMKRMIAVHQDLPEAHKLVFALCIHEGVPVAVLGWFPGGTIGLPLVAATANKGLELSASYPLYWKMIEYYKKKGFVCCDLGGVNYERNRGGFVFKTGLAGEKGELKTYIGQFEAWENIVSRVCFRAGKALRSFYRSTRLKLNERRNTIRRHLTRRR